jgi:hypothetical protein
MSDGFDEAKLGLLAMNASASDRDLVELLRRHGVDEGEILEEYQQFATSAESPLARYLVGLIIEDERRHHRVLEEMANSVAWGGFDPGHPVERLPKLDRSASSELRSQTRRLLEFEQQDARSLKALRKSLKDYADTTPWRLLVDTLLLDTQKHQLILEFILDHTPEPG